MWRYRDALDYKSDSGDVREHCSVQTSAKITSLLFYIYFVRIKQK